MTDATMVSNATQHDDPPAYVRLSALLALILAILSILIPVLGVLFIVPLAIIFGSIALYGGDYKSFGLFTLVVIIIKMIISPTFWANLGAAGSGSSSNMVLAYFDVIGTLVMITLFVRGKRR